MSEISRGLVAGRIDTDGYPLVRLSDAEAIIDGYRQDQEEMIANEVKQSAALKLAREALIGALSDDQPYINASKEALAAIDALKGE